MEDFQEIFNIHISLVITSQDQFYIKYNSTTTVHKRRF